MLATLEWNDISSFFPSDKQIFAATEPSADLAPQPQLIFLGIDERDATETDDASDSTAKASKKQKSLPTKKPDEDTSFQPSGPPYFAIDASKHPEVAKKALEVVGGEENALFIDLRAELLCLDFESTGVIAAARALADWNKRSQCFVMTFHCPADRCPPQIASAQLVETRQAQCGEDGSVLVCPISRIGRPTGRLASARKVFTTLHIVSPPSIDLDQADTTL